MKVSVACCIYNGAPYLGQQLASVLGQTVPPDEIVIIDDGSTDASARIAEDFADRAPTGVGVIVRRNPSNLGVVKNFEKAISLTSGDVIFLCDQDDVWHRSKIEMMASNFETRRDVLLLHSDARLIDEKGDALSHSLFETLGIRTRERRAIHQGAAFSALLARNLVTGATVAMRRSVFDAACPFPEEWVHDEWLAIIAAAVGRVDCVDLRLIDYRQHQSNQIGMRRLSLPEKFGRLFRARETRYLHMQSRVEILLDRLIALGSIVPTDYLSRVAEKLAHVHVRAMLPGNRAARLVPIAREIATRRYACYSSGLRSIAQDCFEPS